MEEFEKIGGLTEAREYADSCFVDFFKVFPLDEIRDMEIHHFLMDFHPEIRPIGTTPETRGYDVSERFAGILLGGSRVEPILYRMATDICAANVLNGYHLPLPLRAFASMAIWGNPPEPKKRRGPPAGRGFLQKMLLRRLALDLVELFDIKLSRNIGSPAISACDIVSEVGSRYGLHYSYNTVLGWCENPDHVHFRTLADEISAVLKDKFLMQSKALKSRTSTPRFG